MRPIQRGILLIFFPITLPVWLVLRVIARLGDAAFPTGWVRRRLQWVDSLEDGRQFEEFCADLLLQNGFGQIQLTCATGDYGADILARRDGMTYAIQCKCYQTPVGNKAVQEADAARQYYHCDLAVVMTNNTFTSHAQKLAEETQTLLWDRTELIRLLRFCRSHRRAHRFDHLCEEDQIWLLQRAMQLLYRHGRLTVRRLQKGLQLSHTDAAKIYRLLTENGIVDAKGYPLEPMQL